MNGILHEIPSVVWFIVGILIFLAGLISLVLQLIHVRYTVIVDLEPSVMIRAYASSIIGDRSSQQDYCCITAPNMPDSKGCIAIVCDGMGGMQGGELASRCCAEQLFMRYYSAGYKSPDQFFAQEIPLANNSVASLRDESGSPLGGGTTLVSVIVRDSQVYYASVGDSRIYLFRSGTICQLTRDHNYFLSLSQAVQRGELTIQQAMSDPQKDALISYIGMPGGAEIIDTPASFPYCSGDILLLCSDGLTKAMSAEEIAHTIAVNISDPSKIPDALTSAAYSKPMRHDNITVAIVNCP